MLRILFFVLLSANPVLAGPDRISVLMGSHHANPGQSFEEFNPGVFLEWRSGGRHSYSVGAYRNSYGRGTVAAGVNYPILQRGAFQADIFAGAAHYPREGRTFAISAGDVVPMLGLRLRYRALYLLTLPGDGKVADFVVGYGLSFPLQ